MKAIFIHELKSYFHSLTAWVFAAFLLCFVGIGAMMYNIQAAVSNFEYVLSLSSLAFVVIAPILAMRVLAEERRQKTDQLLYALPVSTVEVILGKYAALLVLYLVPLAIIAVYPLIFAQFGEVYLPTSYGSIFAFFLLGAALLAVGVFISSLTDNQGRDRHRGDAVQLLQREPVGVCLRLCPGQRGGAGGAELRRRPSAEAADWQRQSGILDRVCAVRGVSGAVPAGAGSAGGPAAGDHERTVPL